MLGWVRDGLSGRGRRRHAVAVAVVVLVGLVGIVAAALPSSSSATTAASVAAALAPTALAPTALAPTALLPTARAAAPAAAGNPAPDLPRVGDVPQAETDPALPSTAATQTPAATRMPAVPGSPATAGPAGGQGGGVDPTRRLTSGRTYELHSDLWLTPEFRGAPRPLVIMLHGLVNTADSLREASAADPFADTHGFAVAYGVAVRGAWNAGGCCGDATAGDVDYIRQIVDDAARHVPVDRSRVYVWGFSNGGMLAARIACEAPDLVAAVGMVGGQVMASCPTVPVRMLHIHGTADTTVPWRGGWSDYLHMNLPDGETEASRFAPGSEIRHQLWDGGHTWPWWAVGALWDFSSPASLAAVGRGGIVSVLSAPLP